MLFPDWANAQEILMRTEGWAENTYTVTQDSFLIGLTGGTNNVSPTVVSINGKMLFKDNAGKASFNYYPCFYCTKGTVLKNTSKSNIAIFKVIPLIKSGGEA